MATSTNYGWTEPDNTGLVKNGASDIRTLGDAIDTSVWNIGYGQAGKNKIINGNFGIWQRGTSFNTNASYCADRWLPLWDGSGATRTISQQTFTPGTAPVSGYEGQYFLRFAQSVAGTGSTYNVVNQRIEDVRNFAGQSVSFSFWAKASGSISMASAPSLNQNFGSGGSATTYPGFTGTAPALTTSWQRFSFTTTVPSITGKTVGTSSYLEIGFNLPLNTTFTIDIWGAQLEYGSKATPFQTASGGSPHSELAMCQRYYAKSYENSITVPTNSAAGGLVMLATTATVASGAYLGGVRLPVTMRVNPTVTIYSFTSSTSGVVSNGDGTDLSASSGSTNLIGNSSFGVQNNNGLLITASRGGFVFHYAASAEL